MIHEPHTSTPVYKAHGLHTDRQHGKYLENVALPNLSPVDRMKAVVAFHVSGLVREVFGEYAVLLLSLEHFVIVDGLYCVGDAPSQCFFNAKKRWWQTGRNRTTRC